jgi:hypothetical protein
MKHIKELDFKIRSVMKLRDRGVKLKIYLGYLYQKLTITRYILWVKGT